MNKKKYGFTTSILHSDRQNIIEHGSLHKPIHTSVAFGCKNAHQLAAIFQGKQLGYRYGRQGNPTISALENKITNMEDGIATICFATGMAAIAAIIQGLIRYDDHIVSSVFLFGNTNSLWMTINAQGASISMVDATDVNLVKRAITSKTRIIFVETIANPRTQIADLKNIGNLCFERNILYVVDNTMTSPYLFQPKIVGASLVVNSLTKSIAGHGNVLGGALTDTGLYNWSNYPHINEYYKNNVTMQWWGIAQIRAKGLRDFGASLSPESAHHIAIGTETIALRQDRECNNAMAIAQMLEQDSRVAVVYYPGLTSHPQHILATTLFNAYGSMLSFELDDSINCFEYLNNLRLAILASNLGDTRTLVIPVAQTIFHELGRQRRAHMGIAESLIRVSVGLEDLADLLEDFQQAFNAIKF